ncbi:MAG TPA: hypothetical protein VMG82_32240 [Candidatus Sulfotelmatobacter sp.]|nr:hypothetical protein [Candidatus Sulfotelmatobacter sp.]
MQALQLFLSPQVDVPGEVRQADGKQLKRYFDLIRVNQRRAKISELHEAV